MGIHEGAAGLPTTVGFQLPLRHVDVALVVLGPAKFFPHLSGHESIKPVD